MDNGSGADIADALERLNRALQKHNELQEEANNLARSLIPALETTAQELLELREHLEKAGRSDEPGKR